MERLRRRRKRKRKISYAKIKRQHTSRLIKKLKKQKMNNAISNHESLQGYQVAKKVWDDIHNFDTLTYQNFEDYFLNEIYVNKRIDTAETKQLADFIKFMYNETKNDSDKT